MRKRVFKNIREVLRHNTRTVPCCHQSMVPSHAPSQSWIILFLHLDLLYIKKVTSYASKMHFSNLWLDKVALGQIFLCIFCLSYCWNHL